MKNVWKIKYEVYKYQISHVNNVKLIIIHKSRKIKNKCKAQSNSLYKKFALKKYYTLVITKKGQFCGHWVNLVPY